MKKQILNSFNRYQVLYSDKILTQGNIIKNHNTLIISQNYIKPKQWSNKWNLHTRKGGFIKINCDILIVLDNQQINVDGMGCFGMDPSFKLGCGKSPFCWPGYGTKGKLDSGGPTYGDKELKCLYHGNGVEIEEKGIGGGVIEIICDTLINYGNITSNGFKKGTGGSIFILCETFNNYGNIEAKGNDNDTEYGNGRIAIYCNQYNNNGSIIPKAYIGK